ncbi:T9SS type A sorting domain-containing protein [Flavobacteriaceae bacterium]|nr:T9SS type A sorting domain-containing protein [Flavobacteriaceae bacterium]
MKKNYFTIALVFCFAFISNAQNTVTVDANAEQLGYATVLNFDGSVAFGSIWGVPDLQTIVDPTNNTLSLYPNFNTYNDNPTDPYWVNQTSLLGNKFMIMETYVQSTELVGSPLTFEGTVQENTLQGNGYVVFNVNNGPLIGQHQSLPANFGGAFTTDGITEDLVVLLDEGSDPDPSDGCEPVTNAADLAGKIAVIRRGVCEFGFKALVAQNAGAIGVVVVNNVEGPPILMGGGDFGDQVTIPVLMVSDVTGAAIIAELEAGNTVNSTMFLTDYNSYAFIKVFNSDFSILKDVYAPLVAGTDFSFTFDDIDDTDAFVQYGFGIAGINANPADEATLGSVVVTTNSLAVSDFNAINVSLFPNPTSDNITIESDKHITDVLIYNTLGQTVKSASPQATNFSVETSYLNSGVYFINLKTDTASKTLKFIKQ